MASLFRAASVYLALLSHSHAAQALFEAHCLPRVISGSSIGSLMASLVGVRNDEELALLFKQIEDESFELRVLSHVLYFVQARF